MQTLHARPRATGSLRGLTLMAMSAAALACLPAAAGPVTLDEAALEDVTAGSSSGAGVARALTMAFGRFNSSQTVTDVVVRADGSRTTVRSDQVANGAGTDGALAIGGVGVTAGRVSSAANGAASSNSGTANVTSTGRATSTRSGDFSVVRTRAVATGPGAQATTNAGSTVSGSGMTITVSGSRQVGNSVISNSISLAFGH